MYSPYLGPAAITAVAGGMVLSSLLLVMLPTPAVLREQGSGAIARWAISGDTIAVQNISHAAFLVCFALSWYRSSNALGLFMVQLSSLLLSFSAALYAYASFGLARVVASLFFVATCSAFWCTAHVEPTLSVLNLGLYGGTRPGTQRGWFALLLPHPCCLC